MIKNSFSPLPEHAAGVGRTAPAASASPPPQPHHAPFVRPGRFRPITLLMVGAGILIIAVALGTAAMIVNLRNRVLTDNEREMRNVALVVAAQVDRIFDGAERVEKNLIDYFAELGVATSDDFERKLSGYGAHLLLRDKIVGLPHVGTFTLVNAQGRVFNFSRSWPIPPIDVTDRDFFEALRQDGGPAAYLSKPIQNRATGTWVVQLARKVTGRNGEFIGLVTAAIELASIEQFFASMPLGPHSSVGLFYRGGELLARHPHDESLVGRVIPSALAVTLAPDAEHGMVRRASEMTPGGEERLIAVHRVAHYPLVVGTARGIVAVLADWHNDAVLLIGAASFIVIIIVALVTLLVRQLSRDERRLQENLDEKKLHLDTAIDNMSQGFVMFDSSARIVIVNQRYLDMYDLPAAVIKPGCTVRELIRVRSQNGSFKGDIGEYCAGLTARIAEGKAISQILETPQGRSIHALIQPMAGGGWIATHEDITERRQAEQERDRNREFLDLILENVPAPIFVKDAADRRYVLVNRAGEEFWGISRAEMIGKTSYEIFPRKEADLITARDDVLIHADQPCSDERQIATPSNGVRSIAARRMTIRGDDGKPRYLIGLINDITDRKQAEDKIRRTQIFLDTIIENVPSTIIVKDARDFRYLMINRAGEQLFGIPRERIVGNKDGDIFDKEQADAITGRDIEMCGAGEPLVRGDHPLHTPGNGVRVITSNRVMLPGDDGKPQYLLSVLEDMTERAQAAARIAHMAHHDALTGLANRALFTEKIEEASARQRRLGEGFAVFMLDLDGFKDINDSLGHPAGDALLKEMAGRLRSALRETDVLARFGGDEFAIIQSGETNQQGGTAALALRLLEVVSAPLDLNGHKVNVATSIGIAVAPQDGCDPDELLKKADLALYRTKSEGRNGFNFFDVAMTVDADERYRVRNEIRDGITCGEFELHYQPVFDVKTRAPCGVETLVRWRHPTKGLLSPDRFIPIAEESGLIVPLGQWILERACADAASWPEHIKVAVNLSPVQFRKGNLFDVILCALVESGLTPERLELEITETVLLENESDYRVMLQQLKNLGVTIVLDDFGQGYSSLGYITRFPVDKIKIDKAFTQGLSRRVECTAIVSSVLTLARGLDITTTAEGVETEEQFELLRLAGVDVVQGYLFGRPVAKERLGFGSEGGDACGARVA
jgi:diguanylate cyclase (GGDEF)-like protein/PAS domain S-box-containing protein